MIFSLFPCDATCTPQSPLAHMPDALIVSCQGMAALCRRVDFVPPWTGHVAFIDGRGMEGAR